MNVIISPSDVHQHSSASVSVASCQEKGGETDRTTSLSEEEYIPHDIGCKDGTAVGTHGTAVGSDDVPSQAKKKLSYAAKEFWDQRFLANPAAFDWYATWEELAPFFHQCAPAPRTVLMVGCGNSTLSVDMAADGYTVTSIDISEVVIHSMREQRPDLQWLQMDATEMTFGDNTFDLVIDKGTVDALVCDASNVLDDGRGTDPRLVDKLVAECCRVCKVGGQISLVSHSKGRDKMFTDAVGEAKCNTDLATRCPLSKSAVMINILRNTVGPNSGIKDAMKDPVKLKEALTEYRDYVRDQGVVKRFLELKAKKGPRLDASWRNLEDHDAVANRKQLYCHIYFIRMQ